VQALHPDVGYLAQWRQALRVVGGETRAAAQVRVQDTLPPDLAGFTGRTAELDRLRRALARGTVVVSAIEGMAGVGKTQLAADADQVRPLLPGIPACPALVTTRRTLTDLRPAAHLTVDVFTPGEALEFLSGAAPGIPAGDDPGAAARIAHRCGCLPLALGLV